MFRLALLSSVLTNTAEAVAPASVLRSKAGHHHLRGAAEGERMASSKKLLAKRLPEDRKPHYSDEMAGPSEEEAMTPDSDSGMPDSEMEGHEHIGRMRHDSEAGTSEEGGEFQESHRRHREASRSEVESESMEPLDHEQHIGHVRTESKHKNKAFAAPREAAPKMMSEVSKEKSSMTSHHLKVKGTGSSGKSEGHSSSSHGAHRPLNAEDFFVCDMSHSSYVSVCRRNAPQEVVFRVRRGTDQDLWITSSKYY